MIELAGSLSHGMFTPLHFIQHLKLIELTDLLNDRKPVSVLEDSFKEVKFVGAIETQISTAEDLIQLIDKASTYRATASTEKNDTSSRSHAICRISIANPAIPSAPDGLLYLIDLAGSEAARDIVEHKGDRLKEAREINKSLSILKDCIRGRAQVDVPSTGKVYIPFRQANLTKALKHVFDPDIRRACKTSVIACVNPSFLDGGPSKNTLRYAEMLRVSVPPTAPLKFDKDVPSTWSNAEARDWISENVSPLLNIAISSKLYTNVFQVRFPSCRCRNPSTIRIRSPTYSYTSNRIRSTLLENFWCNRPAGESIL